MLDVVKDVVDALGVVVSPPVLHVLPRRDG
jgi:hypothetical protein